VVINLYFKHNVAIHPHVFGSAELALFEVVDSIYKIRNLCIPSAVVPVLRNKFADIEPLLFGLA